MVAKQIVFICLGIVLIVVGIPLLVLPGPGLLLIAAGIGVLVSQLRRRRAEPPGEEGSGRRE